MPPRPMRCRMVGFRPDVTYFKPAGVSMAELQQSVLTVDELEALRLKDMEGLEQEECASKMGISQPTFHRLVSTARKKIATALVEGSAIKIEGGNYRFSGSMAHHGSMHMHGHGMRGRRYRQPQEF